MCVRAHAGACVLYCVVVWVLVWVHACAWCVCVCLFFLGGGEIVRLFFLVARNILHCGGCRRTCLSLSLSLSLALSHTQPTLTFLGSSAFSFSNSHFLNS